MAIPIICKLLQKQTYDFLSQRYAIVLCFIGSILVIVSAFHFGETMLEWSKDKYVAVFNSFSDNVAGRSFQNRLCSYLPIDVVYTWVNGSDPKLIQELNKVKADILLGLNFSGPVKCTYAYCFQSNMVLIYPTLPVNYTLLDLAKANPFFLKAMNLAWMKLPQEGQTNESVSVVVFEDFETVPHVLTEYLLINGRNYSVRETYLTTEWTARNSILLEDTVILTGIPSELTQELLLQHLPRSVQSDVHKMLFYPEKSLVVLVTTDKDTVEKLLDYDGNFTVGDKEQNIHTANLVLKLHDDIIIKDALASRFEDNEELRYSLRSVEKHAPWVRHIYIVTNGQIPYWLALDNPKVTIVTHEEIFLNNSDLPTFSSPAIESHIHRIPGLSQKFIYMNDDVMFGKDVWPEDFYTHSKGQKVYLTWAVPGCKEGCPTSWIKDGYCDKPCNSSECDWDGGDCLGSPDIYNVIGMRNSLNFLSDEDANKAYCSPGCTNTWLADRYCDQACNVLACGFDAGDCGLINFNQLYRLELFHNQTEYTLPPGKTLAYIDLKTFLTDIVLTRGAYEENAMIRVIAIIHKYKVLTILLFPNFNATILTLTVDGFKKTAEEKVKFTFNLTADTLPRNESESDVETTSIDVIKEKKGEQNGIVIFEEFPEDKRFPKIPLTKSDDLDFLSNIQVDEDRLSEFAKMQIKNLHQKLNDGELTQKGFNVQKAHIMKNVSNLASLASHLVLNKPRAINLIYPDNSVKEYNQAEQFYPGLQLGDKNQSHFFQVNLIDGTKKTAESKGKHKNQDQFENKPEHRKLLTLQKSFRNRQQELTTKSSKKEDKPRLKLDRFGDSLRHVNKLLNSAYGYEIRKVPGHIPHMIDVEVMNSLHERFLEEFAATSSHRLRSSTDMQFAFSYFYFLMSEPKEFNIEDIFNTFDTDNSGTWSDREIRTIVARLYKLPLDYESMMQFENIIINCSKFVPSHLWDNVVTPPLERYHDSKLPTVSKQLVKSCDEIQKVLMKTFSGTKKHKFEIMGEDENSFKMIRNNVSWLVGQLDDIRKNPKKFICLNDDMDYHNDVIPAKAVLQDFYESLFPIPSQFELSHEFRNRFLHINELREWRKYRDLLKLWTHICLIALILFTLGSFCHNQVVFICRRLMFHRTLLLRGRQDHMLSV